MTSHLSRDKITALLHNYETLCLPVFQEFGGQVIKQIGDAYFVLFDSPTNAVLAGNKLLSVFEENAKTSDPPLQVRIGISVGEVILEKNDVFGEAVNLASRILSIAPPNQLYFSDSVYLSMNKAEVSCEPVGEREFKGFQEKMKVYRSAPKTKYSLISNSNIELEFPEKNILPNIHRSR